MLVVISLIVCLPVYVCMVVCGAEDNNQQTLQLHPICIYYIYIYIDDYTNTHSMLDFDERRKIVA